jgi:hypothetical protein
MGNFKHQSIRATDRDRDSDTDREQERDSSVKDGQERLRNVSVPGCCDAPECSYVVQVVGQV